MKFLKKVVFVFMISLLCIVVLPTKAAKKESATDPTGVSTYTPTNSTTNDIYGMNHTLATATTNTNGNSKGQLINVFEMKTDGVTSKLVTWAVQENNYSYTRADIIEAAKDYEEKHPGWIVTGGINADQYFFKFGNQIAVDGSAIFQPSPYYPMITDGEKRYTVNPLNNSANVVGIKNDGSTNSFAYPDGTTAGYQLAIIDETGNELSTFVVNGVNRNANSSETTVWCAPFNTAYSNKAQDQVINTSNQLYVVENADLAYVSIDESYGYPTGDLTSLFCKGTISNSTLKAYTVSLGQFAIETTNQDVIDALEDGVKIKVEHLFGSSELNAVDEAIGYHSIHMLNGVVQNASSTAPYNTMSYSRALIGKKADGTYVLMTVAKGIYSGTTQDESNAILKQFGVTDAYQQDGGGSVTAIIRNQYGTFDVVNESSDSGVKERAILSGCFFVIRDPGYISYQKDSTRTSITITKTNNYNDDYISNVSAEINGKTYALNNETITIEGLEDDTEYKVKITYEVTVLEQTVFATYEITAHTNSFQIPSSGVKPQNISANQVEFIRNTTSNEEYIYVNLKINDQEYDLLEKEKINIIKNLLPNTKYIYFVEYAVRDSLTKNIYEKVEESFFITEKYNIPSINEFKVIRTGKEQVKIDVKIQDDFNLAYSYYIMYNGNQYPLDNLSETFEIDNLNFKSEDYKFKLIIQYQAESAYYSIESEEIIINANTEYNRKGCSKSNQIIIQFFSSVSLAYLILKKRH